MDRETAMALLQEYTTNPNLIKHMLGVEACMRAYAARYGEDVEKWGLIGLLHDFDYERWPDPPDHPLKGYEILGRQGYPDDVRYAICSHANYLQDRFPRVNLVDHALFACDEISGFVVAVALVKGKSLANVDVPSVTKRLKEKNFARGVNRDDVVNGAAELGVPLEEHIDFVIKALQGIAGKLGLDGSAG